MTDQPRRTPRAPDAVCAWCGKPFVAHAGMLWCCIGCELDALAADREAAHHAALTPNPEPPRRVRVSRAPETP